MLINSLRCFRAGLLALLCLASSAAFGQKAVSIYPPGAGALAPDPVTHDVLATSSVFLGHYPSGAPSDPYVLGTFNGGSDLFIIPNPFDYSEGDLTLGEDAGSSVTLIFDNNDTSGIAPALGENSSLNVPGVAVTCCGPIVYKGFSIGQDGQGTLILQNGADAWIGIDASARHGDTPTYPASLAPLDFSTVGDGGGSHGTIVVDGTGSTFNMTGQLIVGGFGSPASPATGTVVVRNSALLNIEDDGGSQRGLAVGVGDHSVGTVTVSEGSTLHSDGGVSLATGNDSNGTLNLTGTTTTANIVDGYSFVGVNPGAAGAFNVSDGATVTLSGESSCCGPATIEIGKQGGVGSLNVSSGGHFVVDPTTDFGQIRVADEGGNGIGSVNVTGGGSSVQILKSNGSICLGCQAPAFGSLAVFDGATVSVDGSTGWVVVGQAVGAIGIIQVDGAASELDAGDRLCVGLDSDCVTEGGSGKVVISNGGTVRAFTVSIGNDSEVIAGATGGNLIVGGATVKVEGGILRAVGNLNIDGPLEIGPQGAILIEASPSGIGSINVTKSLTINGGQVIVELEDGESLSAVDLGSVVQAGGTIQGSTDLVIQTGDGTQVASVDSLDAGDLLTTGKVPVCHVRGHSGKTTTLTIDSTSIEDLLGHGDTLGACP